MRTRRLGRTELQVSELCFGTGALARPGTDRRETAAALAAAFDLGIDTIEIDGGDCEAAELVGAALKDAGVQGRVHILARVSSHEPFDLPSPHILADHIYPGAHIRTETEALLRVLRVERLAVQQLHAWCPEWLDEGEWRRTLEDLRAEGKIAGVGVSLFDHDVAAGQAAITSGAADCVQVMVNVFDPGAAALFALCRQHDVGLIARSPLYFGALAGGALSYPAGDWRHDYFYADHARETAERAAKFAEAVASEGLPAEAALRFSLSPSVVSTVAVGMHSAAQVATNVAAADKGPLSSEQLRAMAAHRWLC